MNSIAPTNAGATVAASESMNNSRTQSIISDALMAQSFDARADVPDDEALSSNEPTKDGEPHKTDDDDDILILSSEVRSYDVLLRRAKSSSSDSSSYEIDSFSSHVGNARFSIMLSVRRNDQRADKENSVSTNDSADNNNIIASGILHTLYDECNGRLLVPTVNGNITSDAYYRDIGNKTPEAIEAIKSALTTISSPSESTRTSPIPSAPAGEHSSPTVCSKRRKRSPSLHFVVDDVSPGHKIDSATNSNKCRRRSSLKPSSYGAGAGAVAGIMASADTPTSSSAEHVHFSVPIAPSDVTSADVVLPTMHEATFLRPDSGIGNNRLRVMVRMVSSRYFEAASSGDDKEVNSIAEEVVHRVNSHRGREGIRGRFLDTTYDEDDNEVDTALYVEVPHNVAISAVHSFLDEAAGIRTSTNVSTTKVNKSTRRNSSSIKNKRKRSSKKKAPSAKLLHGAPIPTHLMPSNIASLRQDAAEDMRNKKAKKAISTSGRTVHGGVKGFSSTLCDSQITIMQDLFRSMAEGNANAGASDLRSPRIPSSLLNFTSSAAQKKNPDAGSATTADASFNGIPGLTRNHLKQSQARAA